MCQVSPNVGQIKALIPAAGKGTRFYPFSRVIPKELIPVANYPAIDFGLKELSGAGVRDVCLVSSPKKITLTDYVRQKKPSAQVVNQIEPKGLGDAIFVARDQFVRSSIIPVILPDNIFVGAKNVTKTAIEIFNDFNCCAVVAIKKVPKDQAYRYGIAKVDVLGQPKMSEIISIVEKPKQGLEPSTLAVVGRYVFSSCIFQALEKVEQGVGQEIQLTDAINFLIKSGKKVLGFEIEEKFLDVGNPAGWLEANHILFEHGLGENINECST